MTAQEPADQPPEPQEHPQQRRQWRGPWWSVIFPLGLLAALGAALWVLQSGTLRGDGGDATRSYGPLDLPPGTNPTGRPPEPVEGAAAPDFLLPALSGGTVRLSDLRGSVVLLHFWASGCQPCRQEVPAIVAVHQDHRAQGLEVVGIDVGEGEGPAAQFVAEFAIPYPVALDGAGAVAEAYRVDQRLPTSVWINREGVIWRIVHGPMTPGELVDALALLY